MSNKKAPKINNAFIESFDGSVKREEILTLGPDLKLRIRHFLSEKELQEYEKELQEILKEKHERECSDCNQL